jgi:hypothetical protein
MLRINGVLTEPLFPLGTHTQKVHRMLYTSIVGQEPFHPAGAVTRFDSDLACNILRVHVEKTV